MHRNGLATNLSPDGRTSLVFLNLLNNELGTLSFLCFGPGLGRPRRPLTSAARVAAQPLRPGAWVAEQALRPARVAARPCAPALGWARAPAAAARRVGVAGDLRPAAVAGELVAGGGGRVSGMGAGGAERVWAEERVTGERSETRVKIKGNAVISNIRTHLSEILHVKN